MRKSRRRGSASAVASLVVSQRRAGARFSRDLQREIGLNSKKVSPIWIFLMIGSSVLSAYGAKKPPATKTLQIQQFTTAENVSVTDKYMQVMMKNIVKQLANTKRFQTVVLGTTGSPVQSSQPGILLTGQLLECRPGSRAARFAAANSGLVYAATKGGRVGEAKVRAHIQFMDFESGKLLHEEDVEGVVRGNPWDMNPKHTFGQSANATTQKIAKQIANFAKSNF